MAYGGNIFTSIFGRRLGLQRMSSGATGTSKGPLEFLVGPEDLRKGIATETTGTNLAPYGMSLLTTVSSSAVFVLDPPIPGVEKTVAFNSTATSASPIYLKTANGETFATTQGTSMSVLASSQNAVFGLRLMGQTTAIYAVLSPVSSGSLRAATST